MPDLILMCGLPGVGKSTLIKNKFDPRWYVIVSSDNIVQAEADARGLTYTEIFQEVSKMAADKSNKEFHEALKAGKDIIVDKTLLTVKSRKRFLVPAKQLGYRTTCIYLTVSDWRRHRAILDERGEATGKVIPEHVINHFIQTTEVPSYSEGFDYIEIRRAVWEDKVAA